MDVLMGSIAMKFEESSFYETVEISKKMQPCNGIYYSKIY